MKYINNNIYIEFSDFVKSGVSELTVKSGIAKKVRGWESIRDPEDKRRVLIQYDSLKPNYKEKIKQNLTGGVEPAQYLRNSTIQSKLVAKDEDIKQLKEIILPDGSKIDDDRLMQYIEACKYLYLIERSSKRDIKNMGFDKAPDFYKYVISLIKANNISLPSSYQKLQSKRREYQKIGAKAVISKKLGLKNSLKVGDLQKAFIVELYSKPQQFNSVQISILYNKKAKEMGWAEVCPQTVINVISDHQLQTINFRKGVSVWRNANDFIIHRRRPSKPGLLWVGDATPYELYYQQIWYDGKGYKKTDYWRRKVIYAVVDAFNDLIVGYALGDQENNAIAKQAWKNACINAGILPHQVKTDRYGLKELRPFYGKIARNTDFFTPSKVGNARDKVIEPLFGRLYDQVTRFHHNASGRNIKAKEQPNRDYLVKIQKQFPDHDGVIEQINRDIHIWNYSEREKLGGKSLAEQWNEADHSEDRPLTDYDRLDIFGETHKYKNKLTNKGLVFAIEGQSRSYMDFDNLDFYKQVGKHFEVVYDPADYSKILAKSPDGRYKYMLSENEAQPMAFADTTEGDRERLNKKLQFQERVKKELVMNEAEKRRKTLEDAGLLNATEAEALAKGMFSIEGDQKQGLYTAEGVLKRLDEPKNGDQYDGDIDYIPATNDRFNDGD